MSAFNTLTARLVCPICRVHVTLRVQFKYADTWQSNYSLGDKLAWGGNDIGCGTARYVVLDGAGEDCPNCTQDTEFYIFVRNDVLESVSHADGSFDFIGCQESFIVLEA